MIRVLLLIPTLDQSGAEKQLTLLATRLPRDEFEVHVVALTRGGPLAALLEANEVPLTVLGKRGKFDPVALWKLRRFVRRWQPDLLHTWLFAANAYGRIAAGGDNGPSVIVSERCVDSWKRRWQLCLDRRLIGRTARLVGNSHSVAEFYHRLGMPEERLAVIPNGIEIEGRPEGERSAIRAELQLRPEAGVVAYVGRLAVQKRVEDLIWAMELLRTIRERTYLLIIGDGPERDRLVRFARDIRIGDHVRFLGHRSDVSRLLAAADAFWLASSFEGLSNSLMEAMAAGLPVVASDIPPNRELVVPGETGFLVPVGDRAAFARQTERLFADETLARRLAEAGRERMHQHFGVDKMVQAYTTLYRDVVAESTDGGAGKRRSVRKTHLARTAPPTSLDRNESR